MEHLAFPNSRHFFRYGTILLTFCLTIYFFTIINPRHIFTIDKSSNDNISNTPSSSSPSANTYGTIKDKVAIITDTQYTPYLIPLLLHFSSVLGPSWPIILFTSLSTLESHLLPSSPTPSGPLTQAVQEGRIQIRLIPEEFNLTSRNGVNLYLSNTWLWEQLAPATHALVFQADSIICSNAPKTVDSFIEEGWDFIGAPLSGSEHFYNGGLSLRNRTMILEILHNPDNNWEEETKSGSWTLGGEDVWFSRKMDLMRAKLPSFKEALGFSCQHDWHVSVEKRPAGYHKVHKNLKVEEIREIEMWCPEVGLSREGTLEPST